MWAYWENFGQELALTEETVIIQSGYSYLSKKARTVVDQIGSGQFAVSVKE